MDISRFYRRRAPEIAAAELHFAEHTILRFRLGRRFTSRLEVFRLTLLPNRDEAGRHRVCQAADYSRALTVNIRPARLCHRTILPTIDAVARSAYFDERRHTAILRPRRRFMLFSMLGLRAQAAAECASVTSLFQFLKFDAVFD